MTEDRFFVDERSGCIAVRDRQHPKYDPNYNGLHHDTPDIIYYAHGYTNQTSKSWEVNNFDKIKAREVAEYLNATIKNNI